jgi:hypothetical protein
MESGGGKNPIFYRLILKTLKKYHKYALLIMGIINSDGNAA